MAKQVEMLLGFGFAAHDEGLEKYLDKTIDKLEKINNLMSSVSSISIVKGAGGTRAPKTAVEGAAKGAGAADLPKGPKIAAGGIEEQLGGSFPAVDLKEIERTSQAIEDLVGGYVGEIYDSRSAFEKFVERVKLGATVIKESFKNSYESVRSQTEKLSEAEEESLKKYKGAEKEKKREELLATKRKEQMIGRLTALKDAFMGFVQATGTSQTIFNWVLKTYAQIGKALAGFAMRIPIVKKAVDKFNKGFETMINFGAAVADTLINMFLKLLQEVVAFGLATVATWALEKATKAWEKARKGINFVWFYTKLVAEKAALKAVMLWKKAVIAATLLWGKARKGINFVWFYTKLVAEKAALVASEIATAAVTAATWLWNAAKTGIAFAWFLTQLVAEKAALVASEIATAAVTAATWLWNAAKTGIAFAWFLGQMALETAAKWASQAATLALEAATWLFNAAFKALNLLFAASPIGVIVIAFGALLIAATYLGDYLGEKFPEVFLWIQDKFNGFINFFIGGLNLIIDTYNNTVGLITGRIERIAPLATDAQEQYQKTLAAEKEVDSKIAEMKAKRAKEEEDLAKKKAQAAGQAVTVPITNMVQAEQAKDQTNIAALKKVGAGSIAETEGLKGGGGDWDERLTRNQDDTRNTIKETSANIIKAIQEGTDMQAHFNTNFGGWRIKIEKGKIVEPR